MHDSGRASLNDTLKQNDSQVELQDMALPSSPAFIITRAASFAWTTAGAPVLRDLNLTVQRNQFTFIIGPVGSGKSSLLKGLLGETPASEGFVYASIMNAGYVDQSPWIRNGSVRENILGVSNYEELWYGTVVRACALEQDIRNMPSGHNTQVGSAGISLSGGQKQRIALAQAVYSKQPLLILDDVFSGLDAQTEDRVFSRLMGNQGLLRKRGVSVLLVTHAVHRLPFSDYILALSGDGRISEQGSYATLLESGGYVQNLTVVAKSESSERDDELDAQSSPAPIYQELEAIVDEVAELNRQTGELVVYKYYLSSIGWLFVAVYGFLAVVHGASNGLTQLIVTRWTAASDTNGNQINDYYLGIYGSLVVIALLSLMVVAWYASELRIFICVNTNPN